MIGHILVTLLAGFLLFKPDPPRRPPDPRTLDIITITARIHRLEQTAQRIDTLDRMITDVTMCEPEMLHRNFSCSWSSGEENSRYEFWTTGEDMNADHLLKMEADKRAALVTSLLSQIDGLVKVRWRQNGDKRLFRHTRLTVGEGDKTATKGRQNDTRRDRGRGTKRWKRSSAVPSAACRSPARGRRTGTSTSG